MKDIETLKVELTYDELTLLKGQVSREKPAAKIAHACVIVETRNRFRAMDTGLTDAQLTFCAQVHAEATTKGHLVYEHTRLRSCDVCDTYAGYVPYKRRGTYHRKGDPNYKKPRYLSGVELAGRFVRMKGYPVLGCCSECFEAMRPLLAKTLVDVRAEVPESILGRPSKFRWYRHRECLECGWTGHEGLIGRVPCLFEGTFPGQCPECGHKDGPFMSVRLKTVDGWSIVEVEDD